MSGCGSSHPPHGRLAHQCKRKGQCVFINSVSVQSLSHVQLFGTPWTAACQASLSITNSPSLLKLMSIESYHPTTSASVVPFSSYLQSFPATGSFLRSQFFTSGGQSIGVSASASVLPITIQDWFPLGSTGWISLQSKGFSRAFSITLLQHYSSKALIIPHSAFFRSNYHIFINRHACFFSLSKF